jgi:anti-sigma factor RsiW
MSEHPANLIAWLDCELPDAEAADMRRHLKGCASCRNRLRAYTEVSRAFDAFCDATATSRARRRLPRWAAVSSAAAAAALLLAFPRARVELPPANVPSATAPAAVVLELPPAPATAVHRRHLVAPPQNQEAGWLPAEPAIQIAIPAEAIFPPGAIPDGVSFIADVSIAADGSAQRLRLRPRLVELERRTDLP